MAMRAVLVAIVLTGLRSRAAARETIILPATGDVLCCRFSPDGKWFASSTGNHVTVWNTRTWQPAATLTAHSDIVWAIAFSRKGKLLATAGFDARIVVWDCQTNKRLHDLAGHKREITGVAFSVDGKAIGSVDRGGNVEVHRLADRKRVFHTKLTRPGLFPTVQFSSDGRRLAACSEFMQLRMWDYRTKGRPTVLQIAAPVRLTEARDLAFSPCGSQVALVGTERNVLLWNVTMKSSLQLRGNRRHLWCVSFSPNGRMIAAAGDDGKVRIWNAATTRLIQTETGHTGTVWTVDFSADGKWLASGGQDKTIRIVRIETAIHMPIRAPRPR